jgi:hypothetical protein
MSTTTDLRLDVSCIDVKPQDYSWDSDLNLDYGMADESNGWRCWEYRQPTDGDEATCENCETPIVYVGLTDTWLHTVLIEQGSTCADSCDDDNSAPFAIPDREWQEEGNDGPIMSYWYPCPITDPEGAAQIIADLPLCVVEVNGEMGLALTGGGMDLSWEICAAYIRLGFYPPFHFAANLPKMAQTLSDERRLVINAALQSCVIMAGWAERGMRRIAEVIRWHCGEEWKKN